MQPLNPFLRAFFRSTLPGQCTPYEHHILLVPSTQILYGGRDRESGTNYVDLVSLEDFLASHVLRVPGALAHPVAGREGTNVRDARGKARQYSTVNGRTVVIKDNLIYSNKGFRSLNQAQLLSDRLFSPDTFDAQQWIVYNISQPLVGSYEFTPIVGADPGLRLNPGISEHGFQQTDSSNASGSSQAKKKAVKSFIDLSNQFPMIARQMQPGFDKLFRQLSKDLNSQSPATAVRPNQAGNMHHPVNQNGSGSGPLLNGDPRRPVFPTSVDEEQKMRRAVETGITTAIDLFQLVDKQQLSNLGSTTDLTGPAVERMIERYVAEQVHDSVIFPRLCSIFGQQDAELESYIKQMQDIDISQVGIEIEDGTSGKRQLNDRIARGVEAFRKMGVTGSPQEMTEVLLATEKAIITLGPRSISDSTTLSASGETVNEKTKSMSMVNADILVSLLLVVITRSSVRHLQARLSYMRNFNFIDDVESGEKGYALSTFEAVLSYLFNESGALRRASKKTKKLWQGIKAGDIASLTRILEPESSPILAPSAALDELKEVDSAEAPAVNGIDHDPGLPEADMDGSMWASQDILDWSNTTLDHVFPFDRSTTPGTLESRPKVQKRVSMKARSMSSSSAHSSRSRGTEVEHQRSANVDDIPIEKIALSCDASGRSALRTAVEARQERSLHYLLSRWEYFPVSVVLDDCDDEGTTLMSAAVQTSNPKITNLVLDYILDNVVDLGTVSSYFARQDVKGRTVAHYLFHQPRLISRIGDMLPWRCKDKNGQTPLFALCRSYDHEHYSWMVDAALSVATEAQRDALPLHLDDHIDGKGNTLLHVVSEPNLTLHLLHRCDSDVNVANDKRFTPLMVASKYGRIDLVRTFYGDPRVDLLARDIRGLTAVELAKDDDVRNRIDDLTMLTTPPGPEGRITTIVRSFFVEDGSVRMVIKSGAPNNNGTITVTTCRRSLQDFEKLARCLATELPASWLPSVVGFRSPFLIPSKPARSVLRDMQVRLDQFLRNMLTHSTFGTHEMVWEFFLVPDIDAGMLAERSRRKAETRSERVREEYEAVEDVAGVELFVGHARDTLRGTAYATKSVMRRVNALRMAHLNVFEAQTLASAAISTLRFLPEAHVRALAKYAQALAQTEASAATMFYYEVQAVSSAMTAILQALARPHAIIGSMAQARKNVERSEGSIRRSDRWPLGLLDDTRNKMQEEAMAKVERHEQELASLGRELSYTQQTVASELAGWQDTHREMGRQALRGFAQRMVVSERARLEGMKRALREISKAREG